MGKEDRRPEGGDLKEERALGSSKEVSLAGRLKHSIALPGVLDQLKAFE
jgi:hypothetical protein